MKEAYLYSCIDLGSNLCRMTMFAPNKNSKMGFRVKCNFCLGTAAGKNLDYIEDRAREKIMRAIKKCSEILSKNEIDKSNYVATAAFRSAQNGNMVINDIKKEFGLSFKILSPDEEIMYSAYSSIDVLLEGFSFVVDMGGGSTEIALIKKTANNLIRLIEWVSLPYGLFYFAKGNRTIESETVDIFSQFISRCNLVLKNEKIGIVISKSGPVSNILSYIKSENSTTLPSGYIFTLKEMMKYIDSILCLKNTELASRKIVSNILHIGSSRGSIGFIKAILQMMPVDFVVFGDGGVKEGIMYVMCRDKSR